MRLSALFVILHFITACSAISVTGENNRPAHIKKTYAWLKSIQRDNGLVPSYDYTALGQVESGYEISLYDNSLAAIAYSAMGDFDRAEKILSFFNEKMNSEFAEFPGGFSQFRYPSSGDRKTETRWLGDNAWLLIAIRNYQYLSGSKDYSQMAEALSTWIINLQDNSDGGIFSGYDENGSINRIKVVEGNLDAFNAVDGYTQFHRDLLEYLGNIRWDDEKGMFEAWGGSSWEYAFDTIPWGYCAIVEMPLPMLSGANRFALRDRTTYGERREISGFCFDEDLDTIWLEGVGEMVVAYNLAEKTGLAEFYLSELEKAFIQCPEDSSLYGLPYVTDASGTHYGDGDLIEWADKSPWVSSTVWYIFGAIQYDPFEIGRNKVISENDHPWK